MSVVQKAWFALFGVLFIWVVVVAGRAEDAEHEFVVEGQPRLWVDRSHRAFLP